VEIIMRRLALGSILAVLLAGPASAQFGNPGFMAPDTRHSAPGVPAPNQNNTADALFLKLASEGGAAEVALGRLADRRGGEATIKGFGRTMIEDHGKANARLAALAKSSGVDLPKDLAPDHAAIHDALDKLSGAEFDDAYVDVQITEHQKTAQLLQWEMGAGQNAELQRFAAETLPVVLAHLRTAQDLNERLRVTMPTPVAARPKAGAKATPASTPKKGASSN
jgi:putative membrane protein